MTKEKEYLAIIDTYIENANPKETLELIEKTEELGFDGIAFDDFISLQS